MKISPLLTLLALLALAFTLAVGLDSRAAGWSHRGQSGNVFNAALGESRRLFASQFFTTADVYFHSGYYRSIFDSKDEQPKAIVTTTQEDDGHKDHADHDGHDGCDECEKKCASLAEPQDWVARFGQNFRISKHTHLGSGSEKEMLPWIRLAADFDPQMIETYTVGAYFLREKLGKVQEAEQFLREGFRNNPDSLEIIFELGRLNREGLRDNDRARNLWELGVRKFSTLKPEDQKKNELSIERTLVNLGQLEEDAGNFDKAIQCFKAAKQFSPMPDALDRRIADIGQKRANPALVAPQK